MVVRDPLRVECGRTAADLWDRRDAENRKVRKDGSSGLCCDLCPLERQIRPKHFFVVNLDLAIALRATLDIYPQHLELGEHSYIYLGSSRTQFHTFTI